MSGCPSSGRATTSLGSARVGRCVLAGVATETELDPGGTDRHAPPSLEAVRAAFPQLEVLELIGAGGMGAVFKARQPKLDRFVALKLLSEPLGRQPAQRMRAAMHRQPTDQGR